MSKLAKAVLIVLGVVTLSTSVGTWVGVHDASKVAETTSAISGLGVSNSEVRSSIWYDSETCYYGRNDHEVLGCIKSHKGETKEVMQNEQGKMYVNVEGVYVGMMYDFSANKNFYCFDTVEGGEVRRRYVEDAKIDSSVCDYDIDTKCLISIQYGTSNIIAVVQETF